MGDSIKSIRPYHSYDVQRVQRKRDHDGDKDAPHQDADGFAEDLFDITNGREGTSDEEQPDEENPQNTDSGDAETTPEDDAATDAENISDDTPEGGTVQHLDIEV